MKIKDRVPNWKEIVKKVETNAAYMLQGSKVFFNDNFAKKEEKVKEKA